MIALQIKDVNFSYNTAQVIDGVSLTLKQGEFLGIIGPNGAGKSTLLRLICGICKPAAGEIMLFEKPLAEQTQKTLPGRLPSSRRKLTLL
jgi:ABC-type cobalamin/Fe3+-siderophores transport system ATPase subunit